jgi:hypothetical protein
LVFWGYPRQDGKKMAEKLDSKETVSVEELLMSEVIQSEALINLPDCKGIITKQELLEEIKRVQASMRRSSK